MGKENLKQINVFLMIKENLLRYEVTFFSFLRHSDVSFHDNFTSSVPLYTVYTVYSLLLFVFHCHTLQ